MEIRPLRESDDRSAFHSGDPDLDRFFQKYARQNQFRHHVGATYVAVEGGRIQGYATVAAGHLEPDRLPASLGKLPRYPLPVLRLARLAADSAARNQGTGRALLRFVFKLAQKMAGEYGCVGVLVDAKPDAVGFYARFGLKPFEIVEGQQQSRPQPVPLFLSLAEIDAAIQQG